MTVAFSPHGKLLAFGGGDPRSGGELRIWNTQGESKIETLTEEMGFIISLAFAPDGKILVSASTDGKLRVWDLGTRRVQTILTGDPPVAFAPNGKILACQMNKGKLQLWDADVIERLKKTRTHNE